MWQDNTTVHYNYTLYIFNVLCEPVREFSIRAIIIVVFVHLSMPKFDTNEIPIKSY